jgi:hypothetical protein
MYRRGITLNGIVEICVTADFLKVGQAITVSRVNHGLGEVRIGVTVFGKRMVLEGPTDSTLRITRVNDV